MRRPPRAVGRGFPGESGDPGRRIFRSLSCRLCRPRSSAIRLVKARAGAEVRPTVNAPDAVFRRPPSSLLST